MSWSDSIQVDLDALAGRATSNGEYPNLVVALGEPLLSGGLTVLAGLSVVARGSGEIYLSAIENASIPGAEGPVYSEGQGPKVLYEMQYAFGGPKSAVAALGTTECPQPAESRLESFIVTAPKVPVAEHESVIAPEHEMHHSGYDWRESVFADQLTNWCDVVFVGTVEETTRVVTTFLGLPAGAIQALMHVDRDISGAAYENILCYFWGYDVPGRARYRDWWPVPNSNAFAIGQQLFVAARFKKGALFAPPLFFCPIENGNLARGSWFNWQQADSVIERIEERAHLRRQFRVADAIGMAHILSFRPLSLEITHYIRGHGPRQLAVSHVPLPVRGLDEQTPLVVMLEEDQGEWRPIAGRASILVRDSWGRLRTFAGYPLDGSTRIVEK